MLIGAESGPLVGESEEDGIAGWEGEGEGCGAVVEAGRYGDGDDPEGQDRTTAEIGDSLVAGTRRWQEGDEEAFGEEVAGSIA